MSGCPGSGGELRGVGALGLGDLGRCGEELGARCCVWEPPTKPSARRASASAQTAGLDPWGVDGPAFNLLKTSALKRMGSLSGIFTTL